MHAEITSKNLRVFANAIQCLARIEPSKVQWEASASGIILRALDESQSAFIAFYFEPAFFASYAPPEGSRPLQIRIETKCIQQALRSIRSAERLVMRPTQMGATHFLLFQNHANSGLIKTHTFSFESTTIVQAVFDRQRAPHMCVALYLHEFGQLTLHANYAPMHRVSIAPQRLLRAVELVGAAADLSLALQTSDGMRLQSEFGVQESAARSGGTTSDRLHVNTQLHLPPQEFDKFLMNLAPEGQADAPEEAVDSVAFILRSAPLRALLLFAESGVVRCDEVELYCSAAGHPALLSTDQTRSRAYYADLVLATREPVVDARAASTPSQAAPSSTPLPASSTTAPPPSQAPLPPSAAAADDTLQLPSQASGEVLLQGSHLVEAGAGEVASPAQFPIAGQAAGDRSTTLGVSQSSMQ